MRNKLIPSISLKGIQNPFGKPKAYDDLCKEGEEEGIPFIFYHTKFYKEVLELSYYFVVGPKGSGKSAIKIGILNELKPNYGILSLDFETALDTEPTIAHKTFQQAKLKVLSALVLLCKNRSKNKKYVDKINRYFNETKLDKFLQYAKDIAKGLSINIKFLSYDLSKIIKNSKIALNEEELLSLIKENPDKMRLLIMLDELEEISSLFGDPKGFSHYENFIFALYRVKMEIGDNCHILFFLKDGWYRRLQTFLSAQDILEYYRIKETYLNKEELSKIIARRAVQLLKRLGKRLKNQEDALRLVFGDEYTMTLDFISNQVISGPRDVINLCNGVAHKKKKIPLLKQDFSNEIKDFYTSWWNTWENEYRESLPYLRDVISVFLNNINKAYNGKIPKTITWRKLKKALEDTMKNKEVTQKYKATWFFGLGKSYKTAHLFANLGIIGIGQTSGEFLFKWNGIDFNKIFNSDTLEKDYKFCIHQAFLIATGY